MTITYLAIANLRNLDNISFAPHPRSNCFIGANGSGKTSLLEAIHILATSRSFKTKSNNKLVEYQQDCLNVFATVATEHKLGVQKHRNGTTTIRINNSDAQLTSQLAKILPLQLFNPDSFQIIDASPKLRRNLLDWGVFHVKHQYLELTKQYRHVLRQRNHLLRTNTERILVASWDKQLSYYADQIHVQRQQYLEELRIIFLKLYSQLSDLTVNIIYDKGWGANEQDDHPLELSLQRDLDKDLKLKYTSQGPHAADLLIKCEKYAAKDVLSRGQQKLILLSLKLAQGILLTQRTTHQCLYLFDDLCAEFDDDNLLNLRDVILQLTGQFFFTGVNTKIVDIMSASIPGKVFHVKHGTIAEQQFSLKPLG